MSKVKILVVEDEIIIADNICDTLNDLGYEAIEPAINYTEAIESIENDNPDIAILDIQLSGKKTGIDLAHKINESYKIPFIFLTSNSDAATVSQAKKANPPAFLLKPFNKEDLYTSIEIALYNFSKNTGEINANNLIIKDALFVKKRGAFSKLLFDDILYLKATRLNVEIVLKNGALYHVESNLSDIMDKLSSKFIRVHTGYIINTAHLKQINSSSITMVNNDNIPIGEAHREKLLKHIILV